MTLSKRSCVSYNFDAKFQCEIFNLQHKLQRGNWVNRTAWQSANVYSLPETIYVVAVAELAEYEAGNLAGVDSSRSNMTWHRVLNPWP